MSVEQDQHFF